MYQQYKRCQRMERPRIRFRAIFHLRFGPADEHHQDMDAGQAFQQRVRHGISNQFR